MGEAAEIGKLSLGARIAAGHRRTISRCISLIENHDAAAPEVLKEADRLGGQGLVIGITGVPGAGKSTLVPALARRLVGLGKKTAIIAVDPSSPLTGGAILGDRIRDTGSGEIGVYFRSIASRGSLGGLSQTINEVVTLLEAAFDAVLIETVGTGQSEIAITDVAHTTLALTAPGLGDEIQAMKAGILEVADVVVVNKADTDPAAAQITADTLRTTLGLTARGHGLSEGINPAKDAQPARWHPPVRTVSALNGEGLDELMAAVLAHRRLLDETGASVQWRTKRRLARFRSALRDALEDHVRTDTAARRILDDAEGRVARAESDPLTTAAEVARACFKLNVPGTH